MMNTCGCAASTRVCRLLAKSSSDTTTSMTKTSKKNQPESQMSWSTPRELLRVPARPVTFKVLCEVPPLGEVDPEIARMEALGMKLAKPAQVREEVATVVLRVLDWGPDAFADKARFPTGPVCEKGD